MVSILVLSLALVACGNEPSSTSNKNATTGKNGEKVKKYVIGTDATYPPFEFEKDGQYIGIDIDLIHAIAEEEGFEIELKPMNFKGIIPAIQANQIDAALAGISITEERQQIVDFSEPYYKAGLSMVVREDNGDIQSVEDLKGKVIAIKKGTTGAKMADELAEKYGAKVNYFDDSPSMYQEVANKNADLSIEDFPVVSYMLAQNTSAKFKIVGDRLNGDFYGIAVAKGNEELLKKINDGLKKLQDNGKYDEIINKYLATAAE